MQTFTQLSIVTPNDRKQETIHLLCYLCFAIEEI